MIRWSPVRWYDRLGGVAAVMFQMTAIALALAVGLSFLCAALLVAFGAADARLPVIWLEFR